MKLRQKLLSIQNKLNAPKNLYNKFGGYYYRNAEGILEAVKPLLVENKATLVVRDKIEEYNGHAWVHAIATLMDLESDEIIEADAYAMQEDAQKGMVGPQLTGSSSSYARKYALNGLFLIDDTKDADTDEYHEQVANAKIDSQLSKPVNKEDLPTESNANDKCSDKQVKFINNLISQKSLKAEDFISKYPGAKSFADLSKAQAKALIDYLTRE